MGARLVLSALALALSVGCAAKDPDEEPFQPMGDFRLGFNIVSANEVTQGPFSRDATEEELAATVREDLEKRLARYNGDGLYHVGARIEGYVLAQTGIPLVATPRSIMVLAVQVWDDATQEKLTETPARIIAFEGIDSGPPLVGSGLLKSRETQLANLSRNAAYQIEQLLRRNEETWFGPKEARTRIPFDRASRGPDGRLLEKVDALEDAEGGALPSDGS